MKKRKAKKRTALMRRPAAVIISASGPLGVFERMALRVKSPEALGKLIELQAQILDRDARLAFEAAYKVMLLEIPRIAKNGRILNREKEVQSRYSRYEDIRAIVDPILQRHGFHVHTATVWPETGVAEIIGTLTHSQGHSRASRFRSSADASGGKNAIQGLGSAVQYGRRYTLKDLLGIIEEGVDDDGQKAGQSRRRDPEVVASGAPPLIRVPSEPITQKQRQRFAMILKGSGRPPEDVRSWLKARYGVSSSADITKETYDEICKAVESNKALPIREPGE